MDIIDFANGGLNMAGKLKCFVLGEKGMVGSAVVSEFKKRKYEFAKRVEDADILVSATGKPGIVTEDMVKPDAIVIDVGSPSGDCDLDLTKSKASFITPVPGGVGPVTISCLLENLVRVTKEDEKKY
jgi:methylenetetrahydrofolate dehydrogenase (NADP+)/methenyltetrahydrofolate cyclohydrolase